MSPSLSCLPLSLSPNHQLVIYSHEPISVTVTILGGRTSSKNSRSISLCWELTDQLFSGGGETDYNTYIIHISPILDLSYLKIDDHQAPKSSQCVVSLWICYLLP